MTIFVTRLDAGSRGASSLESGDLLAAVIKEDQGELAKRFEGGWVQSGPIAASKPFFSAEAAANILTKLHDILPQHEPIAESVDMPMSSSCGRVLETATSFAQELQHKEVQPLHLFAGLLAEETSSQAEFLKELEYREKSSFRRSEGRLVRKARSPVGCRKILHVSVFFPCASLRCAQACSSKELSWAPQQHHWESCPFTRLYRGKFCRNSGYRSR